MVDMCEAMSQADCTDYTKQKLLTSVLLLDLTEEGGRRKLLAFVRGLTDSVETSSKEVHISSLVLNWESHIVQAQHDL